MTRRYFKPLKTKTIIDTLHFIRQDLVREDRGGLKHVDALLRMYGADPTALNMPAKTPKQFRRRELRVYVLDALKGGPKTLHQIADIVQARRQDLDRELVRGSVHRCLRHLHGQGLVAQDFGPDGCLWRLAH